MFRWIHGNVLSCPIARTTVSHGIVIVPINFLFELPLIWPT